MCLKLAYTFEMHAYIYLVLAYRAMCWLTAQCTCLQAASGGLQMRYPGFETGVQACSFLLPACSSVSVLLSSRHFRYDPQRVQRHRIRGTSYCLSPGAEGNWSPLKS